MLKCPFTELCSVNSDLLICVGNILFIFFSNNVNNRKSHHHLIKGLIILMKIFLIISKSSNANKMGMDLCWFSDFCFQHMLLTRNQLLNRMSLK